MHIKVNWKKQPLGKVPDGELAKKLGKAIITVFRARNKLGITAYLG